MSRVCRPGYARCRKQTKSSQDQNQSVHAAILVIERNRGGLVVGVGGGLGSAQSKSAGFPLKSTAISGARL